MQPTTTKGDALSSADTEALTTIMLIVYSS